MTNDIENYTFDFETEVGALIQDLGPEIENILFVEVAINALCKDDPVKVKTVIGHDLIKQKVLDDITQSYEDDLKNSSFQNWITRNGLFRRFVSIREDEDFTNIFGEENKPLMRLFTLYHETAHTLIGGPEINNDHPFQECAADAYAAIRLFQRFGQEAAPILSMISWSRAFLALCGHTDHLTTTVLDKIIIDSASRDFSKLTTDETLDLVGNYARDWTPKASVLSAARKDFWQGDKATRRIDLLSTTCLTSSVNKLAFYIGAKVAQPLLHPEGMVYNGGPWQFTDEERQKFATAIEKRAAGMILSDVFNATAARSATEPSLTQALKVTRLPGQKQFVYNPS